MPENGNLPGCQDEQPYSLQLLEKIKTRTLEIPLNDHLQNAFYSVQLDLWVSLNLAYLSDISNTIHFFKFRTNKTEEQVLLWKPYHVFPLQDEQHYSAHHCLKPDILLDASYRAFEIQTMLMGRPTPHELLCSVPHLLWYSGFTVPSIPMHDMRLSSSSQQPSLCFTYMTHITQLDFQTSF